MRARHAASCYSKLRPVPLPGWGPVRPPIEVAGLGQGLHRLRVSAPAICLGRRQGRLTRARGARAQPSGPDGGRMGSRMEACTEEVAVDGRAQLKAGYTLAMAEPKA